MKTLASDMEARRDSWTYLLVNMALRMDRAEAPPILRQEWRPTPRRQAGAAAAGSTEGRLMDSNHTLRFPRTSRDAFGHQAWFHDSAAERANRLDRIVFAVGLLACAFVVGFMAGAA